METYDKVDISDTVIGETDKKTSHQNGDIHRVVAIYVFDHKGNLYLQEHLKSGGLYDHSVGGHVKKGETYDEAAKREGKEELGVVCPLYHISNFYSDETFCGMNIRHMFAVYECTPPKSWKFRKNVEVKTILPMMIRSIIEMMNDTPTKFTPGFLNTMQEYIKVKGMHYKLKEYTKETLKYH